MVFIIRGLHGVERCMLLFACTYNNFMHAVAILLHAHAHLDGKSPLLRLHLGVLMVYRKVPRLWLARKGMDEWHARHNICNHNRPFSRSNALGCHC